MSSKKINPMEMLAAFTEIALNDPNVYSIFGGSPESKKENGRESLGYGYELREIELLDDKGNPIQNREKYSHLYRDGEQISKEVFRKGGMCNGYEDGYCCLIHYVKESGKREDGFSFGIHVIVDAFGKTVLSGKGITDYPSHLGGNIAKLNDKYYNLLNGEKIIETSSGSVINGATSIIVEHRYNWRNGNLPVGVYRIDKSTCEMTKIDEIRK